MSSNNDDPKKIGKIERFVEIPCMRKSLLTGISGGVGSGLMYFLFSSNVKRSTHVAVSSYAVITIVAWGYCRYKWSADRFTQRQFQHALEEGDRRLEGSDIDLGNLKTDDS